MNVGFIGLGIMGQPMALNLVRAGFAVTVFDKLADRCAPVLEAGARAAASASEAAAAGEVVVTMLPDTPDVEQVLFGSGGVSGGAQEGSAVLEMSTIAPASSSEFARRLAGQGVEMLDAPVTGGQPGARAGALGIMVGGKPEVFAHCRPVLEAVGKTIVYAGPNGSGLKMKLVNQIVGSLNLLAVVEGLRVAQAAGLDPAKTIEVVSSGVAGSWMLSNLGPKILRKDFAPGFMVKLHQKDLRLVSELVGQLGLDCPGAELSYSLFTKAVEKGLGEQGNHGLYNLWGKGE